MFEFIYLFFFRILSGIQNGFGYKRNSLGLILSSISLMLSAGVIVLVSYLRHNTPALTSAVYVCAFSSIIGTFGVYNSFNRLVKFLPKDIHLWENLVTLGVVLGCVFIPKINLLMIIASVYPAMLFHKGFINIGSGLNFWYMGTDDKTGRTYTIPFLNIKIVRGGNAWRIFLASISIALFILVIVFKWYISIFPFVIDLFGKQGLDL